MRRATFIATVALILVAVLALASSMPSGPSPGLSNETLTTEALQKPVVVSGDLAGVGPFNYTYCGPECQAANSTNSSLSLQAAQSVTSRTCTPGMGPLQCYTYTHTRSNFCVALCQTTRTFTTGGSTVTSTILAWRTQSAGTGSTSSFCGYYCQYTRTHTGATGTATHTITNNTSIRKDIAIILARFSDVPPNRTAEDIEGDWNTNVIDYYQHVSHGVFSPYADVFGWYTMPNNVAYYGADCTNPPVTDCGIAQNTFPYSWTLARDAVSIAEYNGANLTQYKKLIVVHSGNGQESEGPLAPNDVWSVTYYQAPTAGNPGEGQFNTYSLVPETEHNGNALGIWAAEFGHQQGAPPLFWPDMFGPNEYTVAHTGRWELESIGTWNGSPPGSDPAYTLTINQVSAHWLYDGHGFVQVYTQATHGVGNGTASIQLRDIEACDPSADTCSIEVITAGHHIYWIEARHQSDWDAGIPMNGVIISGIVHSVGYDATALRIIDASGTDPTLNHAAFQVGMTYTDAYVKISIESYANGTYVVNVT